MSDRLASIFIWLAACGVIFTMPSPSVGVVRNDSTRGDVGGVPVAVKLTHNGSLCSGTAIKEGHFVITASHCIDSLDAADYTLKMAGQSSMTGVGTIIKHPTLDIALIEVDGIFNHAASLYDQNDEQGQIITAAGYGSSSTSPGSGSINLNAGSLRQGRNILDHSISLNSLGFDFDWDQGIRDGSGLGDDEILSFPGDSGMGYLADLGSDQWSLMAVHSGRIGPANTDQSSTTAARVSTNLEWILEHTVVEYSIMGDINLDGQVRGDGSGSPADDDLAAMIDGWLYQQPIPGIDSWQRGDLNQDGVTNIHDVRLLALAYQAQAPQPLDFQSVLRSVPEPSTAACLALIFCASGRRRRGV